MKLNIEWIRGNRIELLENGEAFYPSVFEAIRDARHEVLVETFILFEDRVGRSLQEHLIAAARRGVAVDLTADGFGSPSLSEEFIAALTDAGVRVHVYEPTPLVRQLKPLHRLHRKITVVDGRVAFVGGINFSEDQLEGFGDKAKQDYSVRIEGPLVGRIRGFALRALAPVKRHVVAELPDRRENRWNPPPDATTPVAGGVDAAFLSRDNRNHRTDIENAYRMAIRTAGRSILIANAYFFPGYRLLRDLRRAARRGVRVRLILQKDPDVALARVAARLLYEGLMKDGVTIYEYCRREMHGKVAVVDGLWSTVGSANLDPLSLSLNLEANVLIRDPAFADVLERRLHHLIDHDCERLNSDHLPRLTMWRYLTGALAYHVSRRFPRWLRGLPRGCARVRSFAGGEPVETETAFDASGNRD